MEPESVMAVPIAAGGSFGAPRLFDRSEYYLLFHSYDVSPDGRFVMVRREPGSVPRQLVPRQLSVILNWSE